MLKWRPQYYYCSSMYDMISHVLCLLSNNLLVAPFNLSNRVNMAILSCLIIDGAQNSVASRERCLVVLQGIISVGKVDIAIAVIWAWNLNDVKGLCRFWARPLSADPSHCDIVCNSCPLSLIFLLMTNWSHRGVKFCPQEGVFTMISVWNGDG